MHTDSELRTRTSLLRRLKAPNDDKAWTEFVERYAAKVYGWSASKGLQEQDRQDVTQEVLVRLATRMEHFEYDPSIGKFRSWLWRVWQSALSDVCKARRRAGRVGTEADSEIASLMDNLEARTDLRTRLASEFDLELLEEAKCRVRSQVEDATWLAFALREDCLSYEEIASTLKKTVAGVKMACSRVKNRIQKELQTMNRDKSAE